MIQLTKKQLLNSMNTEHNMTSWGISMYLRSTAEDDIIILTKKELATIAADIAHRHSMQVHPN
jgi:hypothetical protein